MDLCGSGCLRGAMFSARSVHSTSRYRACRNTLILRWGSKRREARFISSRAPSCCDSSGRLKWYDFPHFAKRWSDEWGRVSIDRFRRKWGLSEDDPDVKTMQHYSAVYRRHFLRRWFPVHPRFFGHNLTTPVVLFMDRMLQFCFGRDKWRAPVEVPEGGLCVYRRGRAALRLSHEHRT